MPLSSRAVMFLLALLIAAGLGYSYAQAIFSPIESSVREDLLQSQFLLGEERKNLQELRGELEEARREIGVERGRVESLSDELGRRVAELRVREDELRRERQNAAALEETLTLSSRIAQIQSYNLSIRLGEARLFFTNATQQAREGNFHAAVDLLSMARKSLDLAERDQTGLTMLLGELTERMPESLRSPHEDATRQSRAGLKGIGAMKLEADAVSLIFLVLDEVSSVQDKASMAQIDRWENLLDQAEKLLSSAELALEEGVMIAPELKDLLAEKIAVGGLFSELDVLRESLSQL